MADTQGKVTRFAAELVEDAAAEGARQSRSGTQQLDHWVRLGRAVSRYTSASRQRVEAALAGKLPVTDLAVEEGLVFNAEIAARIEENLTATSYQSLLAAAGVTTVALDSDGQLVEHRPDGTSALLQAGR